MSDQLDRANDQCYTTAVFAVDGGSVSTYSTTATLQYSVAGLMYTKTAITNGTTPTTDINTGAAFLPLSTLKACIFVWMINASGTVAVAQGSIEVVDADTALRKVHPQFPVIPSGYTPFAYHIVQTSAASSAFTFGSSNWNATGITKVVANIARLPKRPVSTAAA